MNVTVFDFTGIYENESFDFYKKEGFRSLSFDESIKEQISSVYVDVKNISGTNCICDDYAYEEIKRRIAETESITDVSVQIKQATVGETASKNINLKIRFFDNGNYHYMSRILMDGITDNMNNCTPFANGLHDKKKAPSLEDNERKIKENSGNEIDRNELFDLVVFDHHPDMKWTSYGEILSCGCWVLRALKDIPELSKVYIIGADEKLMEEAYQDNPEIHDRVFYYKDCDSFYEMLKSKAAEKLSKNVYISVDKDVLSEDELCTNWDQGEMTVKELCHCLGVIKKHYSDNIIAVDVCGECTIDDEKAFLPLGFEGSNRINKQIISVFLAPECF